MNIDRQINVLLVEDSADDAALLEAQLIRGGLDCRIRRVDVMDDFCTALANENWDIVLSDYHLPDFSAEDVLRELQGRGSDLPLIILSGIIEAEEAVALLKAGAHDFLNKDALARLVPAIEREIRESQERAQRRAAEERVRILSLAVEQSPVSVVITDQTGMIEYVNPKFEEVTGYSMADAVGRALEFTRLGEAGAEPFHKLWATVRAGREYRGEFCNRRRDGQLFWEHATVSPLTDENGAISHFVAVKEDITVRRSYEERLLRQANFDDLTGLPNRVLMVDRLDQAMALAQRRRMMAAVLCIDLDRFKNVNDTLGHAAGDILLKEAARRLTLCVRQGDTVARMGGDEFLIILAGVEGSSHAQRVAERIITAFAEPFDVEGQRHFVTASIGITLFPGDGTDGQVLLRNADLAMYKAKELGRNGYRFFTREINQHTQERLALEGRLRGAVGRGEMLLYYQPIIDMQQDRMVALEALIRWRGPDGQICQPAQFIPVAEEMGLINEVGEWVIATACSELRKMLNGSGKLRRVAVNVSPRQLRAPDFAQTVEAILAHNGIPPQSLEMEITESVLMDDVPETSVNLTWLCDLGVRLSIDDFGTGYSSLGYLQRYPFDTLKIDRSFISATPHSPNAARLVETIITMAQGLGMEVIAEGVENEDQLAFLRSRGCGLVQGYLFSKPVPLDDLMANA